MTRNLGPKSSNRNHHLNFEFLFQVDLAGLLKENPNVTVDVANRVYVKNGVGIKKDFMDSLQVINGLGL